MGRRSVAEEKKRIAEVLNHIFGVELNWERLSIEDLRLLAHILTNDDTRRALCKRLKCPRVDIVEVIDEVIPEEYQGPIIRALKKFMTGAGEATESPQE